MRETIILRAEELAVAKQNRFFGKSKTLRWVMAIKNLRVKSKASLVADKEAFISCSGRGEKAEEQAQH